MKIIINHSSMVPIYEQIVEQIKALIMEGELTENTALPSVRTLSKELKISALSRKDSQLLYTEKVPILPRLIQN